jgi:phage shock protein C
MHTANANPFTRADTLTGTCQAIGEDFGFNPLFLRLAFAVGLFFSAGWTVAAYLGLGCAVLASRLLFSDRKRAKEVAGGSQAPANDQIAPVLAEAA